MQKIINELKFTSGGLLELIVLKMLSSRTYSAHEIYNMLKSHGFKVPIGSIYPLISRLRNKGLTNSGHEEADSGPSIKTFELNPAGLVKLREMRREWKALDQLINRL